MFFHISDRDLVFHYHPVLQQVPRCQCRGNAPPTEALYEGADEGENGGVHRSGYWPGLDLPSAEFPQGCTEGRDSIGAPYPRLTNSFARTYTQKYINNPSKNTKMVQDHPINTLDAFRLLVNHFQIKYFSLFFYS